MERHFSEKDCLQKQPGICLWNTIKFAHVTFGLVPEIFDTIDVIVLVGE